jgi:predicted nucleic acid-binding protein
MSEIFLDSNVLLYASDRDEPEKRRRARALLRATAADGNGVISTQVVQEFFVTATRKLAIDPLKAKAIVATFHPLELLEVSLEDINQAIDGVVLWQVSFWDALILTVAGRASCSVVYSEDLNAGQRYGGVEVKNPFVKAAV